MTNIRYKGYEPKVVSNTTGTSTRILCRITVEQFANVWHKRRILVIDSQGRATEDFPQNMIYVNHSTTLTLKQSDRPTPSSTECAPSESYWYPIANNSITNKANQSV